MTEKDTNSVEIHNAIKEKLNELDISQKSEDE